MDSEFPAFDLDNPPFIEPSPDEEAWEAYLTLALDHLGADGSTGLNNTELQAVETAVGATLPFEVGLLLIMGVPTDDGWFDWSSDPAATFAEWNHWLLSGLRFDVVENGFWSPVFGRRPTQIEDRVAALMTAFPDLPRLFPLFGHRAIPLGPPVGADSSDGNPVLSVSATNVVVYGDDLAAWLHRDFDAPLPTWPTDTERRFKFWSDLTDS